MLDDLFGLPAHPLVVHVPVVLLPLAAVAIGPAAQAIPVVSIASLASLALLGALAARAGGSDMVKGALRVTLWGVLAMAVTAGIGALVGKVV